MTPLTTFTLSPTCQDGAVGSVIMRIAPSSNRTVISWVLVCRTCFSASLPSTAPPTAPTTVAILWVSPSPTWWPRTPPTTPPPTAPTPLPAPLVSTSCTDCTTPHSRHTAATRAFTAACGFSAGCTCPMGAGSTVFANGPPIHPIIAATPEPQNTMRATPATQTSGCRVLPDCVCIFQSPLMDLLRLDAHVVLHRTHALDALREVDRLVDVGARIHETGELHDALVGVDVDLQPLQARLVEDRGLYSRGDGGVIDIFAGAFLRGGGGAAERG